MSAQASIMARGRWRALATATYLRALIIRHGWATVALCAIAVIAMVASAAQISGYYSATLRRSSLALQIDGIQTQAAERSSTVEGYPDATRAKIAVPKDVESADMMNLLLRAARESTVEVAGVSEQGVVPQHVNNRGYRGFRYAVQVRARPSQLVAFLNRLEQASQNALIIDSVAGSPVGDQNWLINIALVAYASDTAELR